MSQRGVLTGSVLGANLNVAKRCRGQEGTVKPLVVMFATVVLALGACSSNSEPEATGDKNPTTSSAPTFPNETESAEAPADGAIEGMFDVGHRELYLDCAGTGSPTVVLEAGDGVPSAVMGDVIKEEFADRVRVCSYDRANRAE